MTRKEKNKKLRAARGNNPSGRFAYAACSTPPGISGVAVIRMSGKDSFAIADEMFTPKSPGYVNVGEMPGYSCAHGLVKDPSSGRIIDSVVLTKFISPNSYTGEDTIEISCHGGQGVKKAVLDAMFCCGARPAMPGEFTKTAFLNGKMDLSRAEAVMDLIESSSGMADIQAAKQLEGSLSRKIGELASMIYGLMAKLEMIIEFPEHEESGENTGFVKKPLEELRDNFKELLETFSQGRILREGFKVAIAGRPNVGKSSMLNTLSGYNRAIVTDVPGTTRDFVEETIDIKGVPVRLIDTAGLRDSTDEVEKIGMEKARETINSADLVLWICSEDRVDTEELAENDRDYNFLKTYGDESKLGIILGKSDITPRGENEKVLRNIFPKARIIYFSAVTGEGIKEVREYILEKYESLGAKSSQELLITNQRHYHALKKALESLEMAIESNEQSMPADILASALRSCADNLAEITGDKVSDEVVNEIFSKFCIGK